jgi:prepilin-type N-terminal cleavage/methylation domain-containing protein
MLLHKRKQPKPIDQQGFTIIEMVIATTVFSVILLVVTFGILQISRSYYKGVNEAATQTVARNIMDTIGQSIQFSGEGVGIADIDTKHSFCVGRQRYSFVPGWIVTDTNPGGADVTDAAQHETSRGLYVEDNVLYCDTSGLPVMNATTIKTLTGGRELLSPNMRIAKLSVTQDAGNASQFKITVRIIYGQDDFIYSPSNDTGLAPTMSDATCKGSSKNAGKANAGLTQFCSVSELSTTVTKRVK